MFQGFSYIEVDFQICISVPLMISKKPILLSQTVGAIDLRRYGSALVMDHELKNCENNINICNVFF